MVCQERNTRLSWTLNMITWGVESCPSVEDVHLGCGVVGRFPRGGERGAAGGPAPGFRLARQPQSCSLYALGVPESMRH